MGDLEEILAAFEVEVGFPARRRALADRLAAEGVSAADVEAIGDHCQRTVEGSAAAARVLVALLSDPARRQERLAELAVVRAAQARRRAHGAIPAPAAWVPRPLPGEDPDAWRRDHLASLAACLARDGQARLTGKALHRWIADELGVASAAVPALIERGRAIRAPRTKQTCSKPEANRQQPVEQSRG